MHIFCEENPYRLHTNKHTQLLIITRDLKGQSNFKVCLVTNY